MITRTVISSNLFPREANKSLIHASLPEVQLYAISAKKPFYHIVMKQISFRVKSGLLVAAFMTFSMYGKAQVKFESEEVKLEKLVPVTDGSVNMEFPFGKEGFDCSVPAQIEFFKAFIGQKILFYGKSYYHMYDYYTFPRAVKRQIIPLPQPITETFDKGQYTVNQVSTRMVYKVTPDAWPLVKMSKGNDWIASYNYNLRGNKWYKHFPSLSAKFNGGMMDDDFFNQFFTLKDVLTLEEADSLIAINAPQHPTQIPAVQKELEKLEKEKAKTGELTDEDDKALYAILKAIPSFYSMKIGKETVYSLTVDNGTVIDYTDNEITQRQYFRPVVFLMEDANGTEYLIYRKDQYATNSTHSYITENHLNYLKDIYVNQDFAQINSSGQIEGETFRCEDLVIYKGQLKAKCQSHKTQEEQYFNLKIWSQENDEGEEEAMWELKDDQLNDYQIVVL